MSEIPAAPKIQAVHIFTKFTTSCPWSVADQKDLSKPCFHIPYAAAVPWHSDIMCSGAATKNICWERQMDISSQPPAFFIFCCMTYLLACIKKLKIIHWITGKWKGVSLQRIMYALKPTQKKTVGE